jgi:hypothetical protein
MNPGWANTSFMLSSNFIALSGKHLSRLSMITTILVSSGMLVSGSD